MHLRVKSRVPCKVICSELRDPCGDNRTVTTLLYSLDISFLTDVQVG